MRRAAVFAHYDEDKIIDEYVIYYLKNLKEIANELIFVSCHEISDCEKAKIKDIVDYIIDENHDEYDFGSYKRGYLYLKKRLNEFDELIFANDSCYGPLYPLSEVFDKMETEGGCDFWGITKNKFGMKKKGTKYITVRRPHIQSYFVVFNKNVFTSKIFDKFIKSVKYYDEKNEIIINCEFGLTETLLREGFECGSYIKDLYRFNHVLISFWRLLIEKYRMPFVKCSVLRIMSPSLTTVENWDETIENCTNYPIELIKSNLERTTSKQITKGCVPYWFKKYFFYLMGFQPAFTKKIFNIAVKKYLFFLKD